MPGKGGLSLPLTAAGLAAPAIHPVRRRKAAVQLRPAPAGTAGPDHASDAYVTAQLERSFRTLDYYKSILPQEETKYE